jgi:hypothetical protein
VETLERIIISLNKNPLELSNVEKSYPLQDVVREYLQYLELMRGLKFEDLTHVNNFKNRRGEKTPDFYIIDCAVIEAKNTNNNYQLSKNNLDKGVIWRFEKYSKNIPRVLIISHPKWGDGVREHVTNNGINIIELGFFVTYDNWVDAYAIINNELPGIIFQNRL